MQGILLVDKPKDWTSFDVVNYVRKFVAKAEGTKPKNTKVGHTGTLDPLATGLLILVIGKEYTRRATEFSKLDKTYEVTIKLGQTSTTGDDEGEKTSVSDIVPDESEIEAVLQKFTGEILQVPPQFSAMKINGQRAYKLARAGKTVELEARPINIRSNIITKYDYPYVQFTSNVSSGTYIRSLAEDIGRELKSGAYITDLRRTQVGTKDISEAISIPQISDKTIKGKLHQVKHNN